MDRDVAARRWRHPVLDEIATAPLPVQEKLLRVIGATHADLPELSRTGAFRADLLDRLAFDVIKVPALRERREEIALLGGHFAIRMTRELGREMFAGSAPRAMKTLQEHDWPGNVRELRNVVERSVYRMTAASKPLERIVLNPFPTRNAAQIQALAPTTTAEPPIEE